MKIDAATAQEIEHAARQINCLLATIRRLEAAGDDTDHLHALGVRSGRCGTYSDEIWINKNIAAVLLAVLKEEVEAERLSLVRLLAADSDDSIEETKSRR